MNIVDRIGQKQMKKSLEQRTIPDFAPGDTVRVDVKVVEGSRERIQAFEGVCIGRKSDGVNSSFTVRKLSYGEGVERVFPLYGPRLPACQLCVGVAFVAQSCIICVAAPVRRHVLLKKPQRARHLLPDRPYRQGRPSPADFWRTGCRHQRPFLTKSGMRMLCIAKMMEPV